MATNPKKEKLALLRVEQLKPKAKRLGVKLTNPSGNAKTKAQLINAIVKAEEKKPAAKKPAAKRRAVKKALAPVVGASKRRDKERQALPPGRRVSKKGKVYNERRANRADIKQGAAKGQMLGGTKRDYIEDIGDRIINDYLKYDENTDFGDAFNEIIDSYEVYYNKQWKVVYDLGYYDWQDNDLGIQPTDVGQVMYLALYELYGDVEKYVENNREE